LEKFSDAKKIKSQFLESSKYLRGLRDVPDPLNASKDPEIETVVQQEVTEEPEFKYNFRRPRRSNVKMVQLDFLGESGKEEESDDELNDNESDEDYEGSTDNEEKRLQVSFEPICHYCEPNVRFQTKSLVFKHLDEEHRDPITRKFHCPSEGCSTISNSACWFFFHLVSHGQPREFSCTECPTKFTDYRKFLRHLSNHRLANTEFTCDRCGEVLRKRHILIRHMKTRHLNYRLFCDQFSASYTSFGALNKHKMNAHDMESQFQCSFCSTKFAYQSELKSHEKRHRENPKFVTRKRKMREC
jgi:hypothetical protein